MNQKRSDTEAKVSEGISWMKSKDLVRLFLDPDAETKNEDVISARRFSCDLDIIVEAIRNGPPKVHGFGRFSIAKDYREENTKNHLLNGGSGRGTHLDKKPGWDWLKGLLLRSNRSSGIASEKCRDQESILKEVEVITWKFTNFDSGQCADIGDLYTVKPIGLFYSVVRESGLCERKIVSEFSIITSGGQTKRMLITDIIKNGAVKREKHIDGCKVHRQNYAYEIRNHRLNRGLMKAFLFSRIQNHQFSPGELPCHFPHSRELNRGYQQQ